VSAEVIEKVVYETQVARGTKSNFLLFRDEMREAVKDLRVQREEVAIDYSGLFMPNGVRVGLDFSNFDQVDQGLDMTGIDMGGAFASMMPDLDAQMNVE
jgi:hypothetical protein